MIGWLSALLDALIPSRVAVRNVIEVYSHMISQRDIRIAELTRLLEESSTATKAPTKNVVRTPTAGRLQREIAAMDPKARALVDWDRLGLEEPSVRS